jgi:hypothetical protein
MPKETSKSLPPAARKKAERLQAAYDAFLAEMGVLKKERRELLGRIRERLDRGKIDELRKNIQKLT